MNKYTENLISLVKAAKTPYHASEYCGEYLKRNGFSELKLTDKWKITPGDSCFVSVFGTTLVAFRVGKSFSGEKGRLKICASHIDWPCFKIKPSPEIVSGGFCKLNAEVYGGPIYSSWFDRPLSLAGKVIANEGGKASEKLIDFENPLLVIPNLAIHQNRDVNNSNQLLANRDLMPVLTAVEEKFEKDGYLLSLIAQKLGIKKEDIVNYDLSVYNTQNPTVVGANGEMLSSPRLDNLTSVCACLDGLIESDGSGNGISVAVFYDHEEVGSKSRQGAGSDTLTMILEKISLCLGLDRQDFINLRLGGILLSCDVAHALHPNRGEMCDPILNTKFNRGVALKLNNNQKYPTDVCGLGEIISLCESKKIPYQKFMNRSDQAGGGTIGADATSHLGMVTIDCGVPLLSMHSSCELMGNDDMISITSLAKGVFDL